MPRIKQQYLDCAIYLYESAESAWRGERPGGSGFLVSVREKPDVYEFLVTSNSRYELPPSHIYAVTNKHVARRGFPVIRLNTIDGKCDVLELDHNQWIPHPEGDDLAVCYLDLPKNRYRYHAIETWTFVKQVNAFNDIGAGDETFMVGRFFSHAGKQRNTPSLRFGNIAMLPFERIKLGEEVGQHMQEAFLVETRSISGFSGSPVFVYEPTGETFLTNQGWTSMISELVGRPRLLGIDCAHLPKEEDVWDGARRVCWGAGRRR